MEETRHTRSPRTRKNYSLPWTSNLSPDSPGCLIASSDSLPHLLFLASSPLVCPSEFPAAGGRHPCLPSPAPTPGHTLRTAWGGGRAGSWLARSLAMPWALSCGHASEAHAGWDCRSLARLRSRWPLRRAVSAAMPLAVCTLGRVGPWSCAWICALPGGALLLHLQQFWTGHHPLW